VHALIFQLAGAKSVFLCSKKQVSDAVEAGKLPRAVLDDGATESFCVSGALAAVHGLDEPEPTGARGTLARIGPGDCLVVPAGLYHDVECAVGAALSLTLRFKVRSADGTATAASDRPAAAPSPGLPSLQRFMLKLALKKATLDAANLDRPNAEAGPPAEGA